MTREEAKRYVGKIMSYYGDKFSIDQVKFNIWFDGLQDLRTDVAEKAFMEYVKASKFPPTIADIREQYDILWNAYKSMVRSIHDSFDVASGSYPEITDEQRERGKKLFSEIVNRYPRDKKERIASELSSRITGYVRQCEDGKAQLTTFDLYMERLANEFTG